MQNVGPAGDYHVLFLEESLTLQALFESWLSGIPTRFATDLEDVPAQFDSTTAVACLSQSLLGDDEEAIRKHTLNRNPYCQLVLIAPRASFITPHEDAYDACLRRPIVEDKLRSTIVDRMKCGVYSALLREFYTLNAKVLWVRQSETSVDEVADVDPDLIQERYQQLRSQLNQLQRDLSTADVETISQSIELHKRYLTEPAQDTDDKESSKYHPRRCPDCKLTWGTDHGNELGDGVVAVGANVWKCTRCREIVHGLGDGGRRVTGQ